MFTSPRGGIPLIPLGKVCNPTPISNGQESEVLEGPSLGHVSTFEPMNVARDRIAKNLGALWT